MTTSSLFHEFNWGCFVNPNEPQLRVKAKFYDSAGEDSDSELLKNIHLMKQICFKTEAYGIAANQIGYDKSLIVKMKFSSTEDDDMYEELINPAILSYADTEILAEEGCLSSSDLYVKVKRPSWVEVEYETLTRTKIRKTFYGMEARVILHEIDHLHGLRNVDRLSKMKRRLLIEQERSAGKHYRSVTYDVVKDSMERYPKPVKGYQIGYHW